MKGLNDLARGLIVQRKLMKTMCLLTLTVVLSLIGAMPVSAQSMEGADTGHSCAGQENASVPLCCLTPVCPIAQLAAVDVLPSPNRLALGKVVSPVRIPATLTVPSLEGKEPFHQDTPQELSAPPGARYRCRNSLTSEEPPQT